MRNSQMLLGYFFAVSATAIWSGNFVIARGLSESIPPISSCYNFCGLHHFTKTQTQTVKYLGLAVEHVHTRTLFSIPIFYVGVFDSYFYPI